MSLDIEGLLRKDARQKVARGAEERTDRVRSEIKEETDAQAAVYGLRPDVYRKLLENPSLWNDFYQRWQKINSQTKEVANDLLVSPRRTTVTSSHSGTVFDTTNWDPKFNRKLRTKITKDLG